jgi:hypothetical protein
MNHNSRSNLPLIVVEIVVVSVLVTLILSTANYFRVVPLSEFFPLFSFLPTQAQVTDLTTGRGVSNDPQISSGASSIRVRQIIGASDPLVIKNSSKEAVFSDIEKSHIEPDGQLRVDMELSIAFDASGSDTVSGLYFKNNFPHDSPLRKDLRVFYSYKDNNWVLEFRSDGKSSFFTLTKDSGKDKSIRVSLIISADGRNITALVPDTRGSIFQLKDSIYSNGNQMSMLLHVPPHSSLTVFSAYYQY